jgi:hypothetical protein
MIKLASAAYAAVSIFPRLAKEECLAELHSK